MSSLDQIRIELKFDFGSDIKYPEDGSLFRIYNKLLKEGEPVGKINYIFFFNDDIYYVLGSLCYTSSGKLVFFPGLKANILSHYKNENNIIQVGRIIDHLTLEENLKKWHITFSDQDSKKKKYRIHVRKTWKINNKLYHWFTMSIKEPPLLEICPKNAQYIVMSPTSDSRRRMQELADSRDGAVFHVVFTPRKRTDRDKFLNFGFYLNLDTNKPHLNNNVPLPSLPPLNITPPSESLKNIEMRQHPVKLINFNGFITVIVYEIEGKLKEEAFLVSR